MAEIFAKHFTVLKSLTVSLFREIMSNFNQEVCFSGWGWGKCGRWIIFGPLGGFPEPDKSFDIKGVNNGYWGGRRWEISTPILAEKRKLGGEKR